MSIPHPIRFSPDLESIQEDEQKTISGLNDQFDIIMRTTSEDYGRAVRSVHAKAHGIIEGELTIAADLPQELKQGLFSVPATHKVYIRLSTNAGDVLPDAISLPRGFAMKVLDVTGPRLPGADGSTQDFIMVNGPVFQAPNAAKFLSGLKLLAKTTDRMEGTKTVMSSVLQTVNKGLEAVGVSSPTIQSLGGAPNVDPLGETYFSVTPFRYGNYIAKFKLRPMSRDLTKRTGATINRRLGDDAIRETVRAEMQETKAVWEFQVQLCRDLEKQPIEDPTVEWSEEDAPFVTVATVTAMQQDSWDEANVRKVDEEMRFSVWTGLDAHRPLGNINRARREPYLHSAEFRRRFNGCPMHEPTQ
ncbi:catalase family protein [Oryzifoliimicrobium ureilyticus]|uniref:catalase family protein n=1 Tax=Oryzifoliimicrobium ureilyticus TaxID=3113724 RepID=UPI0030767935